MSAKCNSQAICTPNSTNLGVHIQAQQLGFSVSPRAQIYQREAMLFVFLTTSRNWSLHMAKIQYDCT